MKLPWDKFFYNAWLNDPELSLCTPSTRGVWIDLLGAMHNLGRVGLLRGTADQLSRLARCSPADLVQALTDLQTTGAADVTERNGTYEIINRRMAREHKQRNGNVLRQQRFRDKHENNVSLTPETLDVRDPEEKSTHTSVGVPMATGTSQPEKTECVRVKIGIPEQKAQFELENRLNFVWDQLCKLYNRPSGQARSYLELSLLTEISRRRQVKYEVQAIIAYRQQMPAGDRVRFFPQSLVRLVEKWDEVLDRARNYSKPTSEKSILEKDFERQLAEARAL